MTRWIFPFIGLLCSPIAMATPEDAANRFVEIWNLDSSRLEQYPKVFAAEFIERRSAAGLERMFHKVTNGNGDIQIHQISESNAEQIRFMAHSVNDKWLEVGLDLDADFRVTGMHLARASAPLAEGESGLSLAEIVELLDKDLSARAQRGDFSGSVLLAKDGKPVFAQAYGLADIAAGRANTLDTPINLGSMNKMFTGLAITQLVAAGKLSFEATVGEYLPNYPTQAVREQVTLHQLLTHTSGMGLYWNEAYQQSKNSIVDLDGFLSTFVDEPLQSEPGSEFHYSNSGPVVLGLIIEAVSGLSYYEYVRKHIYAPAGMTHSDHYSKTEADSGKAKGYYVPVGQTELTVNTDSLGNIGSPAGGGYASANDLLCFAIALYDDRLIDAENRELMTTNKIKQGRRIGYGYLYGDREVNGRRYIGHNGGAPGINADFSVFPDHGYTMVVLSNTNHNASPVADQIRQWLGHAKE